MRLKLLVILAALMSFAIGAMAADDAPRMTKDDLKAKMGNPDVIVLDVRAERDWTSSDSKIKGATREDPSDVNAWAEKYSKEKTIVLYCA